MSESAQLSGRGREASQGFMVTDSSTAESSATEKPKGRGTECSGHDKHTGQSAF